MMLLQQSKEQRREASAVRLFTKDSTLIPATCARVPLQKTRERKRKRVTLVLVFCIPALIVFHTFF